MKDKSLFPFSCPLPLLSIQFAQSCRDTTRRKPFLQRQLSTSGTPHLQSHRSNPFFHRKGWRKMMQLHENQSSGALPPKRLKTELEGNKRKIQGVCKEVKRIFDTHIYLSDSSERPRTYHWPFLRHRQLNSLSIQCLQVLWMQLRTAKRKDQLYVGCTTHVCQD